MEQALPKPTLVEAITEDPGFRIVAIALASDVAILVGRSLFGDPWYSVLGFLTGMISAAALLLLFLRVVQEIVIAVWSIADALKRRGQP